MVEYVRPIMSQKLGIWFAETYFEEREDGLYVIPKDGMVWLDTDIPYQIEALNESVVKVIQEQDTEMLGHRNMIYTIHFDGDNWVIHSIDSEDLSNS